MPRQIEPNANNALGNLLQEMLPRSEVRSENTRAITGKPGLKPDILLPPLAARLSWLRPSTCLRAPLSRKPRSALD